MCRYMHAFPFRKYMKIPQLFKYFVSLVRIGYHDTSRCIMANDKTLPLPRLSAQTHVCLT